MAPIYCRRHRFPAEIMQHTIWLYLRYRDVEELLAERGLDISYETVRLGAFIGIAGTHAGRSLPARCEEWHTPKDDSGFSVKYLVEGGTR
jgi:putative transposase